MKILITTTQVPFVRGGAENLAEELRRELCLCGHKAEIVAIPFKWYPPNSILQNILACQLLDITESCGNTIDLVIGLKFPAYLIPHPNKVLWLLHQHRSAYDLWDHPIGDLISQPDGSVMRDIIKNADKKYIPHAQKIFTISNNISHRLKNYCNIDSKPLYHPPLGAELFYNEEPQNYLFFPSRINSAKRQDLVIKALAKTKNKVMIKFAGAADNEAELKEIKEMASNYKVADRIEWLGLISHEEKLRQYAQCLGVIFTPIDEDYGYITLETMLAAKPIISCSDSGGPIEFIANNETGYIADPSPEALAAAMDELWQDKARSKQLGIQARDFYLSRQISWSNVIENLIS